MIAGCPKITVNTQSTAPVTPCIRAETKLSAPAKNDEVSAGGGAGELGVSFGVVAVVVALLSSRVSVVVVGVLGFSARVSW